MLRVVSGKARGILLEDVNKTTTRPITSRIKTSLFDKIQFLLQDEKIADLYAGTGSMGIEALSRGALHCDFVDSDNDCIETIKTNLEKTNLNKMAKVHYTSVKDFLICVAVPKSFQLILYDPPFPIVKEHYHQIEEELLAMVPLLKDEGGIIFRHPKFTYQPMPEFEIINQKDYGINEITILTPIINS